MGRKSNNRASLKVNKSPTRAVLHPPTSRQQQGGGGDENARKMCTWVAEGRKEEKEGKEHRGKKAKTRNGRT